MAEPEIATLVETVLRVLHRLPSQAEEEARAATYALAARAESGPNVGHVTVEVTDEVVEKLREMAEPLAAERDAALARAERAEEELARYREGHK